MNHPEQQERPESTPEKIKLYILNKLSKVIGTSIAVVIMGSMLISEKIYKIINKKKK